MNVDQRFNVPTRSVVRPVCFCQAAVLQRKLSGFLIQYPQEGDRQTKTETDPDTQSLGGTVELRVAGSGRACNLLVSLCLEDSGRKVCIPMTFRAAREEGAHPSYLCAQAQGC